LAQKRNKLGKVLIILFGPSCHKVGTIYGLVDRAILLSHPNFQEKNLKHVIKVLLENAYPLKLIFNKMNVRIKELIRRGQIKKQEPNSHSDNKKMLGLPYINNILKTIKSSIDNNKYITNYRILNKLMLHKETQGH